MKSGTESESRNKIMAFFSNPVVGILGSLASLIGLILAVIFFMASQKTPDIVYSIHPSKSLLIRSDIPTDLVVSYRGKPIKDKDIVAVTLSLWNDGKESVKPNSILEEINIQLSPEVKVLEANFTKLSRNIVGLKTIYNEEMYEKGIIPIDWKILEPGDGGNLQIIYAGHRDANIEMKGIIEGQGKLKRLSTINLENPSTPVLTNTRLMKWILPGIILISGTLIVIDFIYPGKLKIFQFAAPRSDGAKPWFALLIAISIIIYVAGYIFIKLDEWYPPFGF